MIVYCENLLEMQVQVYGESNHICSHMQALKKLYYSLLLHIMELNGLDYM